MSKNNEVISLKNLEPLIVNEIVLFLFMVIFIVITNIISKKKRKID